ncbi:oligomeric complex COG6-domain-containing protein [Mortierella sp. GBAus27b]|nr:oligomeric complex COG6-domain-containing protein [Mortierella sp. GBAus27b]
MELEAEMKVMNSLCQEMQDRLDVANDKTVVLLEQTDALREQSKICLVRQTIMDAFSERFLLSESEVTILCSTSTAMDVNPAFFDALQHIHADCNALLITEHQRAGLEIMEKLRTYRSVSNGKLYHWMQSECRTMSRPDGLMEVREVAKRAMQALKQDDQYFRSTNPGRIAHVRRNAILRAFIDALTRGGPGGTPRPIELHAHDPIRYIGHWIGGALSETMKETSELSMVVFCEAIGKQSAELLRRPESPSSDLEPTLIVKEMS